MAFGWIKKKAKKAAAAVKKGASVVKSVASKADDVIDKVDNVTDSNSFELAANIGGSAFGVPGLGSSVRKGINAAQDVSDGVEAAYKKTKSTINSISGVYQSMNDKARRILGNTPLQSNDEDFQNQLFNLFF